MGAMIRGEGTTESPGRGLEGSGSWGRLGLERNGRTHNCGDCIICAVLGKDPGHYVDQASAHHQAASPAPHMGILNPILEFKNMS